MSRKTLLIITSVIIILALFFIGYYFTTLNDNNEVGDDLGKTLTQKITDLFPVGTSRETPIDGLISPDELDTEVAVGSDGTITSNLSHATFWKVTNQPVAGLANANLSGITTVLYVDRSNGNVYKIAAEANEATRLTNTTLPGIQNAWWGSDKLGTRVVVGYQKNDTPVYYSALVKLPTSTSTTDQVGELIGAPLNSQIYAVAISPAGDKIFYLTKLDGKSVGVIGDWNNKPLTTVFNSSFGEWLISWPEESTILLQTKAGTNHTGYAYTVNTKTGKMTKIVGGIVGLTALISPDGKKIIYGSSSGPLKILDLVSGQEMVTTINSVAEKCAWTKDGRNLYCAVPKNSPIDLDRWYRGQISYSDTIWEVEGPTGKVKKILDPTNIDDKYSIDVSKIVIDPKEDHLYLVDKKSSSLWALAITSNFPIESSTSTRR